MSSDDDHLISSNFEILLIFPLSQLAHPFPFMGVILNSLFFFIQSLYTNESNRLASFVSPLFLLPFLHCSKGSRQRRRRIRKQMRNRTEQTDRFLLSRRGIFPFSTLMPLNHHSTKVFNL